MLFFDLLMTEETTVKSYLSHTYNVSPNLTMKIAKLKV